MPKSKLPPTERKYYKNRSSPVKRGKGGRLTSLKLHPSLKKIFAQIGIPLEAPFRPDDFQLEALEKLKSSDVLVSAPTGSGKTWIALEAIKEYLKQGKRVWYGSPLKALSNSKYEEFIHELGKDNVGILTGDRKENSDAPVIVGTTEILRNQLYDVMYSLSDLNVDLAILDEAHYLSDSDRGVVWEEVLIYLPHRVKLLLLSATLENGEEIANWLAEIRGVPCTVVNSERRPVPLFPLFLFPNGEITPLSERRGLLPQIKSFLHSNSLLRRKRRPSGSQHYGDIINHLRIHNLLPAIFFLKSRADCDQALMTCGSAPKLSLREEERFREVLETLLSEFPFLRSHRQLPDLIHSRVVSHHAGQLPQWKILIEKMMNAGLLDAIFSTSTVAAGVNFPARTVVIVQSDRFNGIDFSPLTATELHQMTGRAGRRGKDNIGFALVIPGTFQDPYLIDTLLSSRPEPIESQIQINFSMALNLLLSHRPDDIRELLDQSFATFQNRKSQKKLEEKWESLWERLNQLLPQCRYDLKDKKRVADLITYGGKQEMCNGCVHSSLCDLRGRNRVRGLMYRMKKLSRKIEKTRHWLWLDFERHLEFLYDTGFVTVDKHLTPDGVWASQLRVDQPLLIAECIRRQAFEAVSPEILAGLIAPFVSDKPKEIEVDVRRIPDARVLEKAFIAMILKLDHLREMVLSQGFASPPLQLWPAIALFIWAKGYSWDDLLELIPIEEGDLVMLILRTADHLRQVLNLEMTHPALAKKASQTLPLILREPVLYY
ncbi:MAG TPA: DEAD/DEAH box helicase [Thermodesulfobacteriota bacterium]|nr:DEAD/DEAH box helicase [Thermodesulfobacteriota bacterium]